jgi:phosphodiesterase/alkaline phosphatase D-like protein
MNQNLIIGIIVVLVILGGGWYFFSTMSSPTGTQATTTTSTTQNPTPTPTPNPSPTPPTAGAPGVVTDTNVAPTNSTAVVTGQVTPNGAPTTYWYEYGRSTTLGNKTSAQSVGSGFSAIASPGYITGLTANTTYYFRLDAQNSFGTVNGATQSFSTNNNPPGQGTPPAASTNAAGDVTRTSATLNAHVNPHSSETTYWFEYGDSSNFGSVTAFQSGGTGNASTAVSASVSGLNPQTKYYFRINAQNQYGTVNGATQTFTTSGPAVSVSPVVTTQVASPVATTTATVRGTVNPNGSQTTYWFEYSTDSLLGSLLLKTTAHKSAGAAATTVSVEANISGLQSGTTYYYRTVAQNSSGTVRGDSNTFTTK